VVGNAPGARSRELGCNPAFSEFLTGELLPWSLKEYTVSSDPRRTIIGGSSLGGLAATCAAMQYPNIFGNVLSQSGSFWWTPPVAGKAADPYREPNHLAGRFLRSNPLPIRFYMDAGTAELDFTGLGKSILLPNRHLRDVLLAKGYEVHYQEFAGFHTYLNWRGTLADGLIALAGGWPSGE
jgi:enterochelin esterase family protein